LTKKYPSYLNLSEEEFDDRVQKGYKVMHYCCICPHNCKVNRIAGQTGKCKSTIQLLVSSHCVHPGEEPPISGEKGSGTIFFTNCTLRCVFCQNYPISQLGNGNKNSIKELAKMMINLQKQHCHNINLVTPTHFVPQIIAAIKEAKINGLNIPIVYNSSGYESLETLQLLDGIVDIYLPDAKYFDNKKAQQYSGATNYFQAMTRTLREMYRQVGNLKLDQDGIAIKGLIIRHLVLPDNIAGTEDILKWISKNISRKIYISLMAQYFPAYQSVDYPELYRRITQKEYQEAIKYLHNYDLCNGWIQQYNE